MKRALAVFFSLVLVLALLPAGALAYQSGTIPYFGLPGTDFDEDTFDTYFLIDSNGNLTTEGASENSYNVYYDSASNKLTLNDAALTSTVYVPGGITLELLGANTIGSEGDVAGTGVQMNSDGGITVTGAGSLTAWVNTEGIWAGNNESYTANDISIDGPGITVYNEQSTSIYTTGSISISGGSVVNVRQLGGGEAVSIGGTAEVTADYIYSDKVTFGGSSETTVTNTSGTAVSGEYGIDIEEGATVTAYGHSALNSFGGDINIAGTAILSTSAYVALQGPNRAVSVGQDPDSDCSITVTGTLTVNSSGYYGIAIFGIGEFTVDGGTVTINNTPFAIVTGIPDNLGISPTSGGNVTLKNNAELTVTGAAMGMYPQLSSSVLTVENSTVDITASSWGLYWPGEIVLRNASVTCSANPGESAIGNALGITYDYPISYSFYAGSDAASAVPIPVGDQTAHLQDPYVSIVPSSEIQVESVELSASELSMSPGQTGTLTASVSPDNATGRDITWESSDPAVATVDQDGNVTAVGPGTAVISATAGGVRAECVVTVSEPFVPVPDTYEIEVVPSSGGSIVPSLTNASAGSTVRVTVTPDEGYELVYITVDGERIGGTSFTMPGHAVEVSAVFAEIGAELPFLDVSSGAWYYDAVSYVWSNGLMEGTSALYFEPDAPMTRAMFWAVLARMDGQAVSGALWKEAARSWAMAEGVSDGTAPDELITREQMVTMLHRYLGSPAPSGTASGGFSDAADVSGWALDSVNWALGAGVLTGMDGGVLSPQGSATRAQAAAMFMRLA